MTTAHRTTAHRTSAHRTTAAAVPTLQPGAGPVRGDHSLHVDPETVLWGRLPSDGDVPALTIGAGESVTIDTVSHEGILPDQGSDPVAWFGDHGVAPEHVLADAVAIARPGHRDPTADGPHVVSGPIAVRGARPGDVLTMTVLETLPRVHYGVVSNRHGRGALHGEFPVDGTTVSVFADVVDTAQGRRGRIPLTAAGDRFAHFPWHRSSGSWASRPPASGCTPSHPVVTAATSTSTCCRSVLQLHLPVLVPGALAHVGDPHFAQGDGEVALTAMEASLRATIRFDLTPAAEAAARFGDLVWPVAETQEFLVPTGMDPDLDEAVRQCVRHAVAILGARWGMDRHLAYAYLSAATDFNISQVVDLVTGVHARIRKADFKEPAR
ncbi:acetamidase/formamidase family protein [Curtobacterium flaccumfaciens]|nr:acetamidase/formamidase family protein [Curtobacterium flaccumfaciens]